MTEPLRETVIRIFVIGILLDSLRGPLYKCALMDAKTLKLLRESRRVAEIVGDRSLAGEVSVSIAKVFMKLGKFDAAREALKDAEKHFSDLKDVEGMSKVYEVLGDMALARGRKDRAVEFYDRARRLVPPKNPILYFRIQMKAAEQFLESGDYDYATDSARDAFNIAKIHGSPLQQAEALLAFARALKHMKDYERAMAFLEVAHMLAKKAMAINLINHILTEKSEVEPHLPPESPFKKKKKSDEDEEMP